MFLLVTINFSNSLKYSSSEDSTIFRLDYEEKNLPVNVRFSSSLLCSKQSKRSFIISKFNFTSMKEISGIFGKDLTPNIQNLQRFVESQ